MTADLSYVPLPGSERAALPQARPAGPLDENHGLSNRPVLPACRVSRLTFW